MTYPHRTLSWQLPRVELRFGSVPILMGIVNVTPDSFSDGGQHFHAAQAVDFALQLVEQGAGILDIGGESTRPYSTAVDADEELRRVLPVIESLAKQTTIPLSIDTSKPAVARAAIDAGAQIINDVTGFRDLEMLRLAAQSKAAVCAMHMLGTPQTMQDNPQYVNVVEEIHTYLRDRRESLLGAGIECERICLDPGIGFGKTHEHNLTLMANCRRFHDLGCPLLVVTRARDSSRKSLGTRNARAMPAPAARRVPWPRKVFRLSAFIMFVRRSMLCGYLLLAEESPAANC